MALTEDEEIARWDELLKDRYTDADPYYVENSTKTRNGPPVIEQWYPSGGRGRGRGGWNNDRRFDRRRDNNGGGDRRDRRWGGRNERWNEDSQGGGSRRDFNNDRRESRDRSRERLDRRPHQRETFGNDRQRERSRDLPRRDDSANVTRNDRGWEVEEI